VNYRKLNDITIKNRFPMSIIEEILDEHAGAKVFTKLDMRLGYHKVKMLPADEHKTTFKIHQGHYQFKVMPFWFDKCSKNLSVCDESGLPTFS